MAGIYLTSFKFASDVIFMYNFYLTMTRLLLWKVYPIEGLDVIDVKHEIEL